MTRIAMIGTLTLALVATACQQGETSSESDGDEMKQLKAAAATATESLDQIKAMVADLDFTLEDTEGEEINLVETLADSKAVVIEWFNPGCPYVKAYHEDATMEGYAAKMKEQGVTWLAVNSGAEGMQGAGLEVNQKAVAGWDIDYPVLMDMTGEVGKAFGAKTTPHMFVLTPDKGLIYSGAIDDSNGRGEASTNYVMKALKEYMAGKEVTTAQTKSFGCSVKYGS